MSKSGVEFGRCQNCVIQRLPFVLPLTVGQGYAVDVLQTGHSFLFVTIVLDRPSFRNVRETQNYHYVIDELDFYTNL